MRSIKTLKKNLRDIPGKRILKRLFDSKPLHCSMYITDKCNYSCGYCFEYDNTKPHPTLAEIKQRIDKVAELGVMKLALAGGEPLLHPEITRIIRHAKSKRMNVSLSTNGALLDAPMLAKLDSAGLDVIQISIDRKKPTNVTQKALDNLTITADELIKTRIKVHISGVVCQANEDEIEEVLTYGLKNDIPTELRLIHGDLSGRNKIPSISKKKGFHLINTQIRLKQSGLHVHSSRMLLNYQKNRILGKKQEWKCLAGYKVFFVSAEGYFWPCSLLKTKRKIEDMKMADLKQYNVMKECQPQCGIYCAVSHSLFMQHPFLFVFGEIPSKVSQSMRMFHKVSRSQNQP